MGIIWIALWLLLAVNYAAGHNAILPEQYQPQRGRHVIKIIEGKLYNTDTATKIGSYETTLSRGDFDYLSEALYKTALGRYFLAGEGHANTVYATHHKATRSYGHKIIPLSGGDALTWCEQRGVDPAVIAAHFKVFDA